MTQATASAVVVATEATQADDSAEKKILYRDTEEYKILKKLPKRFPKRVNDVYITIKTDFKAQLKRCEYLLRNKTSEIYLHAMGNAINRAICLALQLSTSLECKLSTYTSTVDLEDDLMPLVDSLDLSFQHRSVSAVHIKCFSLK